MATVVLLGFVLGLDSFRASLGLGLARRGAAGQARVALAFGLCDGLAPLVGMAAGSLLVARLSPWTGWVGPLVLGGFGLFVFIKAGTSGAEDARPEGGWSLLGLPLVLSLDNLAAGFGLGAIGVPVVLSAALIGLISGFMALAGLRAGALVGRAMPARAERVGGAALTALALALAFDVV
jgi:putative Mn2+ efflux pump MntP